MPIEGVHTIEGRGTVATGKIEQGESSVGDRSRSSAWAMGIESVCTASRRSTRPMARARLAKRRPSAARHQEPTICSAARSIAAPRTIRPRQKFKGEVYVLSKDEGGRHTPFFNGYKPQFFFRTTNVTGEMQLPADRRNGDAGRQRAVDVQPGQAGRPRLGSHFAIREGGKTVGSGVVTSVSD